MGALTKLKQAIEEGDWAKACDAYQTLTGESIAPPKQPEASSDPSLVPAEFSLLVHQIYAMCAEAVNGDVSEAVVTQENDEDSEPSNRNAEIKEVDGVRVFGLPEDEAGTPGPNKQRQTRRKPRKHKVECTECKKEFMSDVAYGKNFGGKCKKCMQASARERD
jgi:hypothetical protein